MPPKKKSKKGKKPEKKPVDIPTLFYTANTVMQPELLEELEQCQQELVELKQQNQALRSHFERDDRDKGLVFESMQERVARNKEYIKALVKRLQEAEETESELRAELQQVKEEKEREREEKGSIAAVLRQMKDEIIEAKAFITEKTKLQLVNTELMREVSELKRVIERHEQTLQVVNTAEQNQLARFEAAVPEGGATSMTDSNDDDVEASGSDGANLEDEMNRIAIEDDTQEDNDSSSSSSSSSSSDGVNSSFAVATLMQQHLIKPGLVPLICEAMRLYPNEVSIQRDACFLLMHMASEGAKSCHLIVQLGVLVDIAKAVQSYPNDPLLLANASKVLDRVGHFSQESLEVLRRSGSIALLLEPLGLHHFDSARRFFYNTCKLLQLLVYPHTCNVVPQGGNALQEVHDCIEVVRLLLLVLDWCALEPRRKNKSDAAVSDREGDAGGRWEYDVQSDSLKYRRRRGVEARKRRAELASSDPGAAKVKDELEKFREVLSDDGFARWSAPRLASSACSAVMNTVHAMDRSDVKQIIGVDETITVVVKVLRRFQNLPDVVAGMCILIRIGLSPDQDVRKFQMILLTELELVNLLLEIHNPATYDPTENEANGISLVDKRITAEVGALLHALGLGSHAAINSHIVAEQARKAGATSKLVMRSNKKGQKNAAMESGMRGLIGLGAGDSLLPRI